jgi:serine/threonine-protein kinase
MGVGDLVDGKYRLLRVIGEGGWGIVFEGENTRTMKRVAIKVLRAQANVTADVQARFEREAQAAGRIGSEHIVEVFDLGQLPDGTSYMVMELLSGQDLATRLEAGRLDPVVAVQLVLQVLEGLKAAHTAGILHRDLKPENLYLVPLRTGEDFVKILDFGISKFNANTPGAASATMTGAVLGSPVYMAPEQARGLKQLDARADLYSVGALLYECVTGRVPFEGDNFNDLMFKIVLAPRPNPLDLRPDLPQGLVPIMLKSIAVDPNERFQSAAEFKETLTKWLESVGVEAAITPELKRMSRTTTPHGTAKTPTPKHREEHWSAATISAAETGGGTPLAASSTIAGGNASGRRSLLFGLVAAAVVLLAVGGVVITRRGHSSGSGSASTSQPTASTQVAATAATTTASSSPAAATTEAAQVLTPTQQPEVNSALPGPSPRSFVPGRGRSLPVTGKSGAHASATASAEPPKVAESAPPPAPPPPPPATTAAPVSTVEGRSIRTGL